MRLLSETSSGGVHEQLFLVDDVPGVLWSPDGTGGARPLVLLGHGDRPVDEELNRIATENQARVSAGAELAPLIAGFQALVARRTVPEWQRCVDAVQELGHVGAGPAGYWGVSLGCGLGVPFVAAEPRIRAAVLGLGGALASAEAAARITVPVQFLVQ